MEEKLKLSIRINLLPALFTVTQQEQKKFYRIQVISIGLILSLVFLSSVTVALRVLQSQTIQAAQENLDQAEQKVSGLKSTEASLVVLKERLASIDHLLAGPSKQRAIFNIIERLTPPSIIINSMIIDKSGSVSLSATVLNSDGLQQMLADLISKEKNEGRISQVLIESLSRGRDGIYRIGLKIKST